MKAQEGNINEIEFWKNAPKKGRSIFQGRLVYETKQDSKGSIDKIKTHHPTKNFKQIKGREYSDSLDPRAIPRLL